MYIIYIYIYRGQITILSLSQYYITNSLTDRIFVATYKINSQKDSCTLNIFQTVFPLNMNCICMLFRFSEYTVVHTFSNKSI